MIDFDNIYEEYKNTVYHLAISYLKNSYDAEDIVQNVFLKLHKNLAKLENDNHIKNWLIRVTINECKTYLLSNWHKKVRPFVDNEENSIKDPVKDDETLNSVFLLPKKDRLIIHLYYYENYKVKEIASILKIKENTVKQRLARSREKLKDILREE